VSGLYSNFKMMSRCSWIFAMFAVFLNLSVFRYFK